MKTLRLVSLALMLLLAAQPWGTAFAGEAADERALSKTLFFGSYEQDGDLTNGPEPIEWYAVPGKDDCMLLLSKYALDWQYYDKNSMSTPYRSSSLRAWLMDSFYAQAFSDAEKAAIRDNYYAGEPVFLCPGERQGVYESDSLLRSGLLNMTAYYRLDSELYHPLPTEYCKQQGAYLLPETKACNWWVRDGSFYLGYHISGGGRLDYSAKVTRRAVRPLVSVDAAYFGLSREPQAFDLSDPAASLAQARLGDRVFFGTYEQDDDDSNGAEPISWYIAEIYADGSMALISEYALACMPYDRIGKDATKWSDSTLRQWLNGEFFRTAFTETDMAFIVKQSLKTDYDYYHNISRHYPDHRTLHDESEDLVFLPIDRDLYDFRLFSLDASYGKCFPTKKAMAGGGFAEGNACGWWVRSTALNGAYYVDDSYRLTSSAAINSLLGVRPAVVIRHP